MSNIFYHSFCSPSRSLNIYWLTLQIVENQARQNREVFGPHRQSETRRPIGKEPLDDCIIDVHVTDLEAASYVAKDPESSGEPRTKEEE